MTIVHLKAEEEIPDVSELEFEARSSKDGAWLVQTRMTLSLNFLVPLRFFMLDASVCCYCFYNFYLVGYWHLLLQNLVPNLACLENLPFVTNHGKIDMRHLIKAVRNK